MNYFDHNHRQEIPTAGPSLDVIEFEPANVPASIEVQEFDSWDEWWTHVLTEMGIA